MKNSQDYYRLFRARIALLRYLSSDRILPGNQYAGYRIFGVRQTLRSKQSKQFERCCQHLERLLRNLKLGTCPFCPVCCAMHMGLPFTKPESEHEWESWFNWDKFDKEQQQSKVDKPGV